MDRREFIALIAGASVTPVTPASTAHAPSHRPYGGTFFYLNCFGRGSEWLDLGILADLPHPDAAIRDVLLDGKSFTNFPECNRCRAYRTARGTVVRIRLKHDLAVFTNGIPQITFLA